MVLRLHSGMARFPAITSQSAASPSMGGIENSTVVFNNVTMTLPCDAAAPAVFNDIAPFAAAEGAPVIYFGKATEVVPEPTTAALGLLALTALAARRRRRG